MKAKTKIQIILSALRARISAAFANWGGGANSPKRTSAEEMYERGHVHLEKEEFAEAVKWFRRAAKQGDSLAQHNLGTMYLSGVGVPKDAVEAVKWFRRAAEQGYAGAQRALGMMYLSDIGVPRDAVEAAKWVRRAAEQGDAVAQYILGVAYSGGDGVPQDNSEAAKWIRRAAEQGLPEAQREIEMMQGE